MAHKLLLGFGILFLLIGALGFLASAVALATVDEIPGVHVPEGMEITLPPDDPEVERRRSQAETVLLGSFLSGGCGVVLLATAYWVSRRSKG